MTVASSSDAADYARKRKETASADNAEKWRILEEKHSKKLWHPLTIHLKQYMYDAEFVKGENLKEVYENFIYEFRLRINALSLVEIVMPVVRQMNPSDGSAVEFLEEIERTVKNNEQASIRCQTGIVEAKLNNKDEKGRCRDINQVRTLIEETGKRLEKLDGVTPVHAPYYKVSSTYLREIGDYAGYYREALRYLGCEDVSKMPESEQKLQAVCLGFAALLGKDVYNFGELLAHPVVDVLAGSASEEWLIDLLRAFNAGDLKKFDSLAPKWTKWEDLKKNEEHLRDKIRLLSVMEIAFARTSRDRRISFSEIAAKAQINEDQVELLAMRALSRGLVKGSIDEVNRLVTITWVQPRVLDKQQISAMADRIGFWCKDVSGVGNLVETNAKEILTRP